MPMNQTTNMTRATCRKSRNSRYPGADPRRPLPVTLAGLLGAALALVSTVAVHGQADPTLTLDATMDADIRLKDGSSVTIDPMTGALIVTPHDPGLSCGTAACDDVQVAITSFQPTGGSDNTIEAFTTQDLELSWDTRGAWECRGAGSGLEAAGWTTTSFDQPPTRSSANPLVLDLSTLDLAGADEAAFDLTLECRNGSKLARETRNLIVRTVTSASCDGRGAPASLTQDLELLRFSSTTTRTWESVFGAEFPGGTTVSNDGRIENGQYASLSLDTVDVTPGQLGNIKFQDTVTASNVPVGKVVWSISQCPGDFGPAVPDSCRGVADPTGIIQFMRWQVGGTSSSRCVMEPDAVYFINMVPARRVPDGQDVDWDCAGSSTIGACEFLFNQRPD